MSEFTVSELHRFVGIAAGVMVCMIGGVYWLHHLPSDLAERSRERVVQIQWEPSLPKRQQVDRPQSGLPAPQKVTAALASLRIKQPDDHNRFPLAVSPTPTQSGSDLPSQVASIGKETASHFQEELFRHIEQYKRYPAAIASLKGTVRLVFVMNRQGDVLDLWVDKSSGVEAFDKEAVETVRRALPLPAIPQDLPDPLSVVMPVAFAGP
jgi:protein TonB